MNHLRISGHHLKNPLKHHRAGSNDSPVSPTGSSGHGYPPSMGTSTPPPMSSPHVNSPKQGGGGSNNSRASGGHQRSIAEQYEVDKARIIQSCFSKRDEQGRLIDTYVTHVRITEDSQYPGSRPPANSPESNKKHRVIVISVKDSGNVCVHKARENPNGSFQIGKTWSLDLLSSIINDPASINGFTITLGKDYYWTTKTGREHDTFLTSIVRIYKKFTKGNVPHLSGLDHIISEDLRTPTSPSNPILPPSTSTGAPTSSRSPRMNAVPSNRRPGPGPQAGPSGIAGSPPSVASPRSQGGNGPNTEYFTGRGSGQSTPGASSSMRASSSSQAPQLRNQQPPPQQAQQISIPQDRRTRPSDLPRLQTHNDSRYAQPQSAHVQLTDKDKSMPNHIAAIAAANLPPEEVNGSLVHQEPPLRLSKPRQASTSSQSPSPSAIQLQHPQVTPLSVPSYKKNNPPTAYSQTSNISADSSIMSSPVLETRRALYGDGHQRTRSHSQLAASPVLETQMAIQHGGSSNKEDTQAGDDEDHDGIRNREGTLDVMEHKAPSAIQIPFNEVKFDADTNSNKSENSSQLLGTSPYTLRPSAIPLESVASSSVSSSVKVLSSATGMPQLTLENESDDDGDNPTNNDMLMSYEEQTVKIVEESDRGATQVEHAAVKEPYVDKDHHRHGRSGTSTRADVTELPKQDRGMVREPSIKQLVSSSPEPAEFPTDQPTSILDTLAEFGWSGKEDFQTLETLISNRINRLNKQNVSNVVNIDEQLDELDRVLDEAGEECGTIGRMLSFAAIQLNSFGDDIGHIEGQSQGVQVETTNQKLLWTELSRLLETIGFHQNKIQVLQEGNFHKTSDISRMEIAAVELYKAVQAVRQSDQGSRSRGEMKVVRERRTLFEGKASAFNDRFISFFQSYLGSVTTSASGDLPKMSFYVLEHCNVYNGLTLFVKQTDHTAFKALVTTYEKALRRKWNSILGATFKKYETQMSQFVPVEASTPGKDSSSTTVNQGLELTPSPTNTSTASITSTSTKAKLKRTGTLAKLKERDIFRERRDKGPTSGGDKATVENVVIPEPALRRKLIQSYISLFSVIVEAVVAQQEVILTLFHLSSAAESVTFPDYIKHDPAQTRNKSFTFVYEQCLHEIDSDYNTARELASVVGGVFSQLSEDMTKFVNVVVAKAGYSTLALTALVDGYIKRLDKTSQDYLLDTLSRLRDQLSQAWAKIMESRPALMTETIVAFASKKRRGVIPGVRAFVQFCLAVEEDFTMVGEYLECDSSKLNAYQVASSTYEKIGRAITHSLERQVDSGSSVYGSTSVLNSGVNGDHPEDSEDKSILNHHILMIYNMNVLTQLGANNSCHALETLAKTARLSLEKEMDLYVRQVMYRPLGKLLDFVDSKHDMTRHAFKKVVAGYDAKELRNRLDTLRKRVEKHFDEDPKLQDIVWMQIRNGYYGLHKQLVSIEEQVSLDSPLLEFNKADITAAFGGR